jgi:hypothetical protein
VTRIAGRVVGGRYCGARTGCCAGRLRARKVHASLGSSPPPPGPAPAPPGPRTEVGGTGVRLKPVIGMPLAPGRMRAPHHTHTHMHLHTYRQTNRQTDRQTARQTDRHKHRHRNRHRHRHTHTHTHTRQSARRPCAISNVIWAQWEAFAAARAADFRRRRCCAKGDCLSEVLAPAQEPAEWMVAHPDSRRQQCRKPRRFVRAVLKCDRSSKEPLHINSSWAPRHCVPA